MYVPFEQLPDHARLWIYQADRKFSVAEEEAIDGEMRVFCEQWVAHGNPLRTSFRVARSQFLILGVDEGAAGASGCSIAGSASLLKSLPDRMTIVFLLR